VSRIANALIGGQHVQHAYVGVLLSGASAGGAEIASVQAGMPGAQAGLKAHDLITAIDGKPVTSTDQFIAMVDQFSPGQTVTMTIRRAGQTQSIKVKLGTRPAQTSTGG
jgi:S1-C subfamily serine protease